MNKYAVVFEAPAFPGDNWSSYVPDLPGCIGIGETIAACRESIASSISLYIADLRQRSLPIPPPSSSVEIIEAA